jgi:hypothetical protein
MYTFLECYLPPTTFDTKPEMDLKELNELFELNLSQEDKNRLAKIRVLIDIINLRSYFTADRISLGGSVEPEEIGYCLEQQINYPLFVFDYLEKYKDINDRIHHFRELLLFAYDWLLENSQGFLYNFFEYDRKLWITSMAYLSKKRERELKEDFDFLDPYDSLTTLIQVQHESEHFEFPEGLEGIDLLLDVAFKDPLKEIEMISRLRYNFCQTYLQTDPFTLDSLFAYYTQVWVLSDFYESQDQNLTKKGGDLLLKRIQEIK